MKYKWGKEYPEFTPDLSPKEMLELGVFEGKYVNDFKNELPKSWLKDGIILKPEDKPDPNLNYFKVKSRQPLSVWKKNGWINEKYDKLGWFQWYIRFYLGRRIPEEDKRQIGRWKSFVARHKGQLEKNCDKKDLKCRPRQRQGLLQWAMDSRKI